MKYEDIKKRLIKEVTVVAVGLSVLGGAVYFLTTVLEDHEQKKNDLQTQVASVTNERQTLENKYQKIQQNLDLYAELMTKSENDGMAVDRQVLRAKIEEFKTRFFLNDLSINMGATQEPTGSQYRYKSSQMVTSDLSVTFDTLTDEDIYNFLYALQNELPGGLKITKLNVSRASKATDEAFRTIAKSGQFSMVKGEAKFTWFGIKSVEADEPKVLKVKP